MRTKVGVSNNFFLRSLRVASVSVNIRQRLIFRIGGFSQNCVWIKKTGPQQRMPFNFPPPGEKEEAGRHEILLMYSWKDNIKIAFEKCGRRVHSTFI